MDAIELEGIKNQLHNGTLRPPLDHARSNRTYEEYAIEVTRKLGYFLEKHLSLKTWRKFREGDKRGLFIPMLVSRLQSGIDRATYKTASVSMNIYTTYQEKSHFDNRFDKLVKKEFTRRWEHENMPKRTEEAVNAKIKDILGEYFNENRAAILQEAKAELDHRFQKKLAEIAQLRRALRQHNVDGATVQRAKEVAHLRTDYLLQKEQTTLRKKLSKI